MSSNTGGCGDSEADLSRVLVFGGRPGFLVGVLIALVESLTPSFFSPFLLKSTAVLLFTPAVGVEVEDLSDIPLVGVPGFDGSSVLPLSSVKHKHMYAKVFTS
jgi:hypothetical protein